jgi:CheY-like chemotaxis protein
MSPEVRARALDPFYTTKPQGKGTGLGLSIVYGTMKAHGGSVELDSSPGQGTRVHLLFPSALQAARPNAEEPSVLEPGPPPHPAASLRILLVDDDDWVRDATTPMLQQLGHEVVAVDSGRAALDCLSAGFSPDLVILDQNMPGMSGTETLLRILKERPSQWALMASGAGEPYLGALPPGARVSYIPKPFTLEELCRVLES